MTEPVVIVCVRDPDSPNSFTVYGEPKPTIIDVDLGYADLSDAQEFTRWAENQVAAAGALPREHPARVQLLDVVTDMLEMHHVYRWPNLDSLLAHIENR